MNKENNPILTITDVRKEYHNHTALSGVSLSIPTGSIYGLLGPNGAGKTSLIRIITQITGADEGKILFEGEELAPKHIAKIGYLPEERGLYPKMKVGEQLMYLGRLKGIPKAEIESKLKYWLTTFDMKSWWGKEVGGLSKGMQQKVQFVATVLHQPKLLILDEPFSGFDPVNANLLKDEILKLREQGTTVIFSTHRMESVEELCDTIALINKSRKIFEGKKADIKMSHRTHIFEIQTDKPIKENGNSYEILKGSQETDFKTYLTSVKINEQAEKNALVQELINDYEIIAMQEKLPSINDIFIKMVEN
ncbi:ABC transporter ATP-binding protein [Bernardetia sp.]|uniref:ABC transporter ATP-binding protein n=1 Tax=Bernardetia sp. TaxID=1937974 RepID=UPI0025BAC5DA|nr:ATP-binding cassette domain-containing protein [Bernardetia sp.]